MLKKPIEFEPICVQRRYYTTLTIYPPGTWFNEPEYVVLYGECSVGHAPTLKKAKALLADYVAQALMVEISDAQARAQFYMQELARFQARGLRLRRTKTSQKV